MKQIFTILVALLATTNLWAQRFQYGELYYNITSDTTVEVTYQEFWSSNNYSDLTTATIPETVTYEGTTYSVTSIGDDAFRGCSSLTSVTIPNSVTSIGESAFIGCSSLTSVTIPNSVTSIGNKTFWNCYSLTSVTIGDGVTSIGKDAFSGCSGLTKTNYAGDIAGWCNIKFGSYYANPMGRSHNFYINDQEIKDLVIPNTVDSIHNYAFYGCSSLTSLTIPESVTSIGDSAFYNCSSLTSVTIPNSVTSIGESAFTGCSSLTSVTIPNSVTSIGNYAFSWCSSLTSITIPESVTSIGESAFYNCYSLTSVTIPSSVTSIGDDAFSGCSSLTSVTIPNSVTSIGESAFTDCSSLTSVTIPNSVTSIGKSAFYNCYSLTSVTIPESVTSIGNYAFYRCYSLTSVTIPESVTSIGRGAFIGCSAIDSIVWNAKNCADASSLETAPFYAIRSQITSFTFGENVEHIPAYLCDGMEKLTSVTIPNSVKTIGTSAFEGCARLGKISLGTGLEEIAANAFAGCTRLYDIYTYATYPPFADESSFANYNVYVYIPCEYQRDYTLDVVWGKFKFIECIDSEDATTDGNVTVVPGFNDVTITWPTAENADSYSLVINKDNQPFCTLTFNQDGQLLNIAFAPSRDGNNRPAQYAAQTVSGYRFTVTGLTEATQYAYNITTKDADNNTIATYSGEFKTQSNTPTDVGNLDASTSNVHKLLRNGQLIIVRDGIEYNAMGQEL